MKIYNTNIAHKIKHLEPIFGMSYHNREVATGGMNGELKFWSFRSTRDKSNASMRKLVKKHTGCVTVVKYSKEGKYLFTGGDDGKLNVFENKRCIFTHKHPSDILCIATDGTILYSADIDGNIRCFDIKNSFNMIKQLHVDGILTMETKNEMLVVQTTNDLQIFQNMTLLKKENVDQGILMEHMACKVVLTSNYIIAGTSFNSKNNAVNVYSYDLKRLYSLIGHVAPVEVVAVKEFDLKQSKNTVVICFCQDLTVSFWTTLSCKPFLLLKNFSTGPALDYFWMDTTLYVSFYDGTVKAIAFDQDELSELKEGEEEIPNMEFSTTFKKLKEGELTEVVMVKKEKGPVTHVVNLNKNKPEIHVDTTKTTNGATTNKMEKTTSNENKVNNTEKIENTNKNDKCEEKQQIKRITPTTIALDTKKKTSEATAKSKKVTPEKKTLPKNELTDAVIYTMDEENVNVTFSQISVKPNETHRFDKTFEVNDIILNKNVSIKLVYDKQTIKMSRVVDGDKQIDVYEMEVYSRVLIAFSYKFLLIYSDTTKILKVLDVMTGILLFPFIVKEIGYLSIDYSRINIITKASRVEIFKIDSENNIYKVHKLMECDIPMYTNLIKLRSLVEDNILRIVAEYKHKNTAIDAEENTDQITSLLYFNNLWLVIDFNINSTVYSLSQLEALIVVNFILLNGNPTRASVYKENITNLILLFCKKVEDVFTTDTKYKLQKILAVLKYMNEEKVIEEVYKIILKKKSGEEFLVHAIKNNTNR